MPRPTRSRSRFTCAPTPSAKQVEICGPVRRWCEIVDHFAYAVATDQPDAVIDRVKSFALVTSIDRRTDGPVIAYLAGGMRAELYLAPPAKLGWAQIRATGSREHVALLRARAADRGMNLDILEAADEPHVYRALGLPWIPPEVRDGTDEVSAAAAGDDFSDLVTLDDLTAAAHCHTTYSDGKNSIAEMVRAAAELGFEAITITDHSAAASYAGGLDAGAAPRPARGDRRARRSRGAGPARHRGRHPGRRRDRRARARSSPSSTCDRERPPAASSSTRTA